MLDKEPTLVELTLHFERLRKQDEEIRKERIDLERRMVAKMLADRGMTSKDPITILDWKRNRFTMKTGERRRGRIVTICVSRYGVIMITAVADKRNGKPGSASASQLFNLTEWEKYDG